MKAFVAQLEGEGIFARALETNGVPYHSPVLQPLLAELSESKLLTLLAVASQRCIAQLLAIKTWLAAGSLLDLSLLAAGPCGSA